MSVAHHGCTVEEHPFVNNGHTDNCNDIDAHTQFHKSQKRMFGIILQLPLSEKVATGVSRQTEFGKAYHINTHARSLQHKVLNSLSIVCTIRYAHSGNCGCNSDKSLHSLVLIIFLILSFLVAFELPSKC